MPSEIRFGFRRHFLKFNFLRSKPKYEISFLPSFKQILCLSAVISVLGACTVVADVYGQDSATMNAAAAEDYMKTVELNKSAGNVDTTSKTARRVQAVFRRMLPCADAANNTGHKFDWKMTVFKNDELNAWAMPGGKIAFYTGIVDKLKLTDGEIAAIMGHEMTHALHEHGKNKVGQKILTNMAAQIGTQIILDKKPDTNPELVGLGMDIFGTYGITLPYSRSLEEEADEGGMMLMAQAGYHPAAAVRVWEKMNQENDQNGFISAITSTHPTNNARIENLKRLLPTVMPVYEQSVRNKGRVNKKRRR